MSKASLKFNPHIADAPLYVAGTSVEDTRRKYGLDEIVKMASNESPLGPSPKAMAAIQTILGDLHRYPPAADDDLRAALVAHVGRGVTPEHFMTGNGATEIIDMLTRGFVQEGENIAVCRPTFPLYEISARRCGGEPLYADMDANFAYDADAILGAINEKTRIVFLCTPNNPTGTLLTAQQAERLVAEIPERVLIVFDESYRVFVRHETALFDTTRAVLDYPNVVSLHSFSKAYGLSGLRIGYGMASPEVATYIQRLRHPFHCSQIALQGAMAALDDGEYVERVRALVAEECDWLTDALKGTGLEVVPSHTNFVMARATYPAQLIYERSLSEGLIIRPLGLFYLPEWFRVTVGRREENEYCIDVLRRVLQSLAQEGVPSENDSGDDKIAV